MPNKKKYEHGGKVEDKTGPESDHIEIEVHESEYVLSVETVEALGEDWLDAINTAFQDDSEANPLWVMIEAMDTNSIRLGRLIKSARILSGLTQAELADRVGLAPGSVSLAERGCRMPTPATLGKLLAAITSENDRERGGR